MQPATRLIFLVGFLGLPALASNLDVANVMLRPINRRQAAIELDLAWEYSWHDEVNHDAAWVFVKFSLDDGATWRPATLKGTGVAPAGTSPGSNSSLEIVVPADAKGAFVRRASLGSGSVATTGLRLVWDLTADEVPPTARGRISVHALEMVYIPQGPFYVGDGSSERSFAVTWINTASMTHTLADGAGTVESPRTNLTTGIGRPYGVSGVFTNLYPNGYNAFYILKYELSRARYLDFLNKLTYQQATNLLVKQASFRGASGTLAGTHPNLANAQDWRAMLFHADANGPSHSGWREYLAYLDWAGLRPLTEMEFEKACRGPTRPVDFDLPWGTPGRQIVQHVKDAGTATESKLFAEANLAAGGAPLGFISGLMTASLPLRGGALADASSDQLSAGASYYGVLGLAGNAPEPCVCAAGYHPWYAPHADALKYSGLHGDGQLKADGTADVVDWPYQTANFYTGGSVGVRGGEFASSSLECAVASRNRGVQNGYVGLGIRAARTAP